MISLQLADFGAEVIKIEDPKKGRSVARLAERGSASIGKVYSRNKKSVALSLREARWARPAAPPPRHGTGADREFSPRTLEAMGLDPEILHNANPGLIIVRVSGWGRRALPRPSRFGTLSRACRLCRAPASRPRARFAADRTRRHGRRALRCHGGGLSHCARRGQGGKPSDRPAAARPAFSFIATEPRSTG